ncbi:RNA 2',3'-cyclic phosphodiesterase [Virgibacillus xinjiangensis]|uniref:RNA 2',3'-cyclic phosphodiesterase n=1 Tax=Virgibacillus xinjiangensis TaxID=393090 RepID=A0ABV7CV29_9BACI
MNSVPHYFVAIPLPDERKNYFKEIQKVWKKRLPYKQWPHREDLHITLKFLGAVTDSRRKQLEEELSMLENQRAFNISTGGLGYFGKPDRPRVLWGGVEKTDQLQHVYDAVEACAEKVGFQREKRPYKPHITIAKNWIGGADTSVLKEAMESDHRQEEFTVDEVVLFRIHPGHSPKYEVAARYQLKGKGI